MKNYRDSQWLKFRNEVIELDNETCVLCGKKKSDGAILQVHHKTYTKGLALWEHSLKDCETVCKGCHAEIHGKIKPRSGWKYIAEEDLGDLIGQCDYCGSSLRYLFTIFHENWGCLEVGTYCCDTLTESESASSFARSQKRREERAKRFLESPRWKIKNGIYQIKQSGFPVEILPSVNGYLIAINNINGKTKYKTPSEAMLRVFGFIESGEAAEYFKKYSKTP